MSAQGFVTGTVTGDDRPPARGLFTLGVPRSGTTVIGRYVASGPRTLDMGEYAGFYIANGIAPPIMMTYPSSLKYMYTTDLQDHARHFAEDAAAAADCEWFADDTPWNLGCVNNLALQMPDAIFVLMLRHYRGGINSLRRLYDKEKRWAGANIFDSASVWANSVASMTNMPWERTVIVGYDKLCREPEPVIAKLRADLAALGYDTDSLNPRAFCASHANPKTKRKTIGTLREDGTVEMGPITSLDEDKWNERLEEAVLPLVTPGHQWLLERFPDDYLPEPVTATSLAAPALKKPRVRKQATAKAKTAAG